MIWLKLQGKKSGGKKCRKRSKTEEVSENTKTRRFPDSSPYITGAEHTLQIMRQAPVVIFVVNEIAASFDKILTMDERVSEICNAQSIGAAIENMTLTATELGLGQACGSVIHFCTERAERMAEWRTLCGTGRGLCRGKNLRQTKEKTGKYYRMAVIKIFSLKPDKNIHVEK